LVGKCVTGLLPVERLPVRWFQVSRSFLHSSWNQLTKLTFIVGTLLL
jgi:hypothetical protein